MTDQTENTELTLDPAEELRILKQRADLLGVKYSNNIGLEALRERVNARIEAGDAAREAAAETVQGEPTITTAQALSSEEEPDFSKMSQREAEAYIRQKTRDDALKLIRIRVACLDPKKKEVPGEVFSVSNKFIGSVKKYVPFGEATDNGYHVPNCIYQMMKARKFLQITNTRDRKTGTNITKTRYVPEFAIEVLPQLTEDELTKLAVEQQASGRLRDDD